MKITAKTNEDVSYRGEPIRKMERAFDRAMKKAGFSFVRTTKMGDHQFKKDGKTYSYYIHGQSGDSQYFDYVTVTKGEVGWDKDIEQKSFDGIDGAVAWLSTKTSEKRIAKKYGAKNEGPGAGYFIKLENVNVDKVWVDSARQYSILKAKFSADWEANHSYWGGEGSADDFEVAIYLDRSLDEFMEWPGAEEEYAQKGSLFDFVKDTCLDDIKNMLNFDCGREGYTYGGGWTTKIPSDGVFEFDNMQFDPDACTVYQYHDKSSVPVSITSEDMMYGIQDAWDEWNNPENSEDESKQSEASEQMAINAYANKRFYDPEEFVKYVRKVAGKNGSYLSVDSVVSVGILDKANRLVQKDWFTKSEGNDATMSLKKITANDFKEAVDAITPYHEGDVVWLKELGKTDGGTGLYLIVGWTRDLGFDWDVVEANGFTGDNDDYIGYKIGYFNYKPEIRYMLQDFDDFNMPYNLIDDKDNGLYAGEVWATDGYLPNETSSWDSIATQLNKDAQGIWDTWGANGDLDRMAMDDKKSEGKVKKWMLELPSKTSVEEESAVLKENGIPFNVQGTTIFIMPSDKYNDVLNRLYGSIIELCDVDVIESHSSAGNKDVSKKSEDASSADDLLARHNQKWLVKVSYDVDASHSAVAPSIVRADTKDAATNIALKRHRGLGYNMKVVSVEPMTESHKKSEGIASDIRAAKPTVYLVSEAGNDYDYDELLDAFEGEQSYVSVETADKSVELPLAFDRDKNLLLILDDELSGKDAAYAKELVQGFVDGKTSVSSKPLTNDYVCIVDGMDYTATCYVPESKKSESDTADAEQVFKDMADSLGISDRSVITTDGDRVKFVLKLKLKNLEDYAWEYNPKLKVVKNIASPTADAFDGARKTVNTVEDAAAWLKGGIEELLNMEKEAIDLVGNESKKSESLTLKQAELKKMAKYGEAEDITSLSDAEAKELKKSGVELVGISRGIYGMNGALMRGTTDGKLYVITSRNSNLFYFV